MINSETIMRIEIDHELKKIISQFNALPDMIAGPRILKNAINATARKARNQLVKGAKEEYAIKKTDVLKDKSQGAPQLYTASPYNQMTAIIKSRGHMQDIMTYSTRPNKGPQAAAAQILASGSMKPLEMGGLKAFVTKFASGHVAIVQRKGPERLPVKKLLSPAVPMTMGNETVREKAETLAYEMLQKEIDKRIQKVLGKA